MIKWFNQLESWAKRIIAIVAIIAGLSPVLASVYKVSKKYLAFIKDGPELILDIEELKNSMYVLTGVVAAELNNVDEFIYYAYWMDQKITGRIKVTSSGNKYVFISDDVIGERCFSVYLNQDTDTYHFYDFSGNYIPLIKIQ